MWGERTLAAQQINLLSLDECCGLKFVLKPICVPEKWNRHGSPWTFKICRERQTGNESLSILWFINDVCVFSDIFADVDSVSDQIN